jgi:oligoribonuclease NrnB/cAMP/cGMP phosphodiesterase (DHH superfamily)
MDRQQIVIYHGNCADGFSAAYAHQLYHRDLVRKGQTERQPLYVAGIYNNPPPDVTGADVILLDFSYKRETVCEILRTCHTLTIIDHHISAYEDLKDLQDSKLSMVWDMNKSGAVLAWEYFIPQLPVPEFMLHIQDRDLWRFKMPHTREFMASVFSYAYTFDNWDKLFATPIDTLIAEGPVIERKHFKDIEELSGVTVRMMSIRGHVVPTANVPYTLGTDMAVLLLEKFPEAPFAAYYYDVPGYRVFGLRARQTDDVNVSAIAASFPGGGGHVKASGFRVPIQNVLIGDIQYEAVSSLD